jgi:hypothetical protein
VGYAMFGPPKELPDEKNGETGTELLIDWLWCIVYMYN